MARRNFIRSGNPCSSFRVYITAAVEKFVLQAPGETICIYQQLSTRVVPASLKVVLQQAAWRVQASRRIVIKYLAGHTQHVTCLAALSYTVASGSADKVRFSESLHCMHIADDSLLLLCYIFSACCNMNLMCIQNQGQQPD